MHHPSGDDQGALGDLLVLLHGIETPFRSVRATYRIWRHEQRLHEAFVADAEEQKRRGASISMMQFAGSDEPASVEREETVAIWRDGERFREERHGGPRAGYYAVADGSLWWSWDQRMGAMSNQDDPSVGSGIGDTLEVMLNPTPLLSLLRFVVTGSSEVAARSTITARATPRPYDPRRGRASLELHELGTGAEHYLLEIDREHGVLLAVTAIRADEPFQKITTLAIAFDEPIAPEAFRFEAPEGEAIQGLHDRHRVQHVTLVQAQQRAPFMVLMPDRVPTSWQVHCSFIAASQRPPSPPQVSLGYHSDDGHESVSIDQMAAGDRAAHHYENMVAGDDWQDATQDASVKVRPAGWGQAQAYLERHGTFVFLVSDNLTGDQLATIAAGLRPAPDSGSI